MKILVLSDSHSSLATMRRGIEKLKPDHVVHLGDTMEDAQAIAQEYPQLRFHMVPGNCDRRGISQSLPDILCYNVGGVMLYMTHGHRHGVKSGTECLLAAAREKGAQAVLFGHTHRAVCRKEEDGLWVINPGSCGMGEQSMAVIEIQTQRISACYMVSQAELWEL